MSSQKLSVNLLETLLAQPAAVDSGPTSVRESLFLEQTIDVVDVEAKPQWQLRRVESINDTVEVDESDLSDLPRRLMIEPGEKPQASADYRLIGSIGRGGTGIVFQAHQRAVNREVAVKVLRSHLRKDRAARQRFLAEARTIGALDHPNVIAVHELAADLNGQLFYSMKRIDGTAWSEVMEQRTLDDHLAILLRVADAVRYAHSRGIIHRDIKPANVMLGRYGEVLVADWGLALPYPLPTANESRNNSIGGTPAYMAPEVAGGALVDVGPHTDVYLLGATLFELLTGFPPHDGQTLLECIENAAANRIRETDVQSELMDIAMVAMATEPSDRYLSVELFQQAIRDYQQHQESIALVRRASKHATEASEGQSYERFSLAMSLIREALDLWPENRRAKTMLKRLQVEFARVAADDDDFDLALSLLEAADEVNSDLGSEIKSRYEIRSAQQKLEERYSSLFANSPDAVLVSRMSDGMVLDANDTFLRLFEHRRDEVVGHRVADIQLWDCPERRVDFIRQIRETGRSDNFETVLRTRSDRKIPVLISARKAVFDNEMLVVAHTRDITLRRAAEDELKRSQERLRQIQQLANLGTWEHNVKTGQTNWSDETYRILSLTPQAVPPDLDMYLELVHPEDRVYVQAAIDNAFQNGAAYQLQVRHRRPDGSYNTTIARGQPIVDSAGQVVELYGTLLDITDRIAAADQMTQQLHNLQGLLDFSDRPLVALRPDGLLMAAATKVGMLLGRRTSCFRCQVRFEPLTDADLPSLVLAGEVAGQFFEDDVPLGPVVRLRLEMVDGMLRGEIVDPAID